MANRFMEYWYLINQTIIHFFCIETSLKRKSIIVPFLKREYTEQNKMKFVDVMSRLDWEDIYSATDMQCAFSLFHSKLIDAHHRCFPEKSFTRTYHHVSGMQLERKINCIVSQSKLNVFELRKCMKTIAINYVNWWELLKRNITQIKSWKTKKNKKKLWSIIKSVINRNKKTKLQEKFKLNDGSYTADMKIICEKFNDFLLMWGHPYPKRYLCKIAARINI